MQSSLCVLSMMRSQDLREEQRELHNQSCNAMMSLTAWPWDCYSSAPMLQHSSSTLSVCVGGVVPAFLINAACRGILMIIMGIIGREKCVWISSVGRERARWREGERQSFVLRVCDKSHYTGTQSCLLSCVHYTGTQSCLLSPVHYTGTQSCLLRRVHYTGTPSCLLPRVL